jgi:hypothetical protein
MAWFGLIRDVAEFCGLLGAIGTVLTAFVVFAWKTFGRNALQGAVGTVVQPKFEEIHRQVEDVSRRVDSVTNDVTEKFVAVGIRIDGTNEQVSKIYRQLPNGTTSLISRLNDIEQAARTAESHAKMAEELSRSSDRKVDHLIELALEGRIVPARRPKPAPESIEFTAVQEEEGSYEPK